METKENNETKLARLNIKTENSAVFNILLINEDVELIEKDLAIGTKIAIKGTLINYTYKNKLGEEKQEIDILAKRLKVLTLTEKIPLE